MTTSELSRYADRFGVTFSGRESKRKSTLNKPLKAKRQAAKAINGKLDTSGRPRGL